MENITLVDDREKHSRQEKALKTLEPAQVTRLICGDYVHGDVAVEFKTAEDMVASIQDYRVFNECSSISEVYKYPYLIIAGDVSRLLELMHQRGLPGRITVKSYLGAIASLSMIVNVITVANEDQALTLMQRLFEKHDNSDGVIRGVRKPERKTVNPAATYLSMIRGISTTKALKICELTGVETLTDLLLLDTDKLLQVEGIGKKSAINIMRYINGER